MRTAFAVDIWDNEDSWVVTVIDKDQSPWSYVDFLGNILNREEALNHEWISDVFHITDHIVTEDKPVMEYFA